MCLKFRKQNTHDLQRILAREMARMEAKQCHVVIAALLQTDIRLSVKPYLHFIFR